MVTILLLGVQIEFLFAILHTDLANLLFTEYYMQMCIADTKLAAAGFLGRTKKIDTKHFIRHHHERRRCIAGDACHVSHTKVQSIWMYVIQSCISVKFLLCIIKEKINQT